MVINFFIKYLVISGIILGGLTWGLYPRYDWTNLGKVCIF